MSTFYEPTLASVSSSGAEQYSAPKYDLPSDVGTLVSLIPNKYQRDLNKMIREERQRLKSSPGLSEGERTEMTTDASRQAAVAQQMQNAALARQTSMTPVHGKSLQAQGDIAQAGALARSQAAVEARKLSHQIAAERRAKLAGLLQQKAAERKAAVQQGVPAAMRVGQTVGSSLAGPAGTAMQKAFSLGLS